MSWKQIIKEDKESVISILKTMDKNIMYLQYGVFKPATRAEQKKHEKMIFDVLTKMREELQKAIEVLEGLQ